MAIARDSRITNAAHVQLLPPPPATASSAHHKFGTCSESARLDENARLEGVQGRLHSFQARAAGSAQALLTPTSKRTARLDRPDIGAPAPRPQRLTVEFETAVGRPA